MQNVLKLDVSLDTPKTRADCPVCGSEALSFDAVTVASGSEASSGGDESLHLAECHHCEHRWTWRDRAESPRLEVVTAEGPSSPRRAPGVRGVASAA